MFCYSCPHRSRGETEGHPQPCLTAPPPVLSSPPLLCFDLWVPGPGSSPAVATAPTHYVSASTQIFPISKQHKAGILSLRPHQQEHYPDRGSQATPLLHPSALTPPVCLARSSAVQLSCPMPWGQVPLGSHSAGWECGGRRRLPIPSGAVAASGSSSLGGTCSDPALVPPPHGEALPDGLGCHRPCASTCSVQGREGSGSPDPSGLTQPLSTYAGVGEPWPALSTQPGVATMISAS